jgi:hypothetical protein
MFGFAKKKDLEELKEQILGYLDNSEEKQSLMEKYEERIMTMALKEQDPEKLEDIRSANQIRRGILGDIARSKKMKRLGRMGKLSGSDEEEEEEPDSQPGEVPTLDFSSQLSGISSAIDKLDPKTRALANAGLKLVSGHSLDDIKRNPALAIELADKFKGFLPKIPQLQAKKKDGTVYTSGTGQQVDINDPQGYALA